MKTYTRLVISHKEFFEIMKQRISTENKITSATVDDNHLIFELESDTLSESQRKSLEIKLKDCDITARAMNALKGAEMETLKDLVSYNKMDFRKFNKMGEKTVEELDNLLRSHDLKFGMDV
jgi:DNA-directed RNA polymerase alpha subunit